MYSIAKISSAALLAGGMLLASLCGAAPLPAASATASATADARAEAIAELETYYFEAARSGDQVLIKEYVKQGFPVDARTPQGYTALILAAYHGQLDTVKGLIALGANPCAKDQHGSTALMGATFKGELAIARLLLSQPCTQANDQNRDGQTAAMYAALGGNGKLIEMLRQRGANLKLQDAKGNTAASIARQQGAAALAEQIDRSAR